MKRFFGFLAASIASLAIFASCEDSNIANKTSDGPHGGIRLESIAPNGDYKVTTYGTSEAVDVNNFKVEIFKIKGSEGSEEYELAKSWEKYSAVDKIIELPIGKYKVVARSGDLQPAAFDAPYFYGEKVITIDPDVIASLNMTCTLGNVKVRPTYSDAFLSFFGDNFNVTIFNEDCEDSPIIFTKSTTSDGYVSAKPFKIVVTGNGSVRLTDYVETVAAADFFEIKIDVKKIGNAIPAITVSTATNNKDHIVDIPTDEETLGDGGAAFPEKPDDPTNPEGPTEESIIVTGIGFDIDQTLSVSTSNPRSVKVSIKAPKGIESLVVTIDSPSVPADILNGMFGGDSFDMANLTPDVKGKLVKIGLIGESDVIKGAKSYSFDVTSFMTLLGEGDALHKFKIKLVEAGGTTVNKVLTIKRVS